MSQLTKANIGRTFVLEDYSSKVCVVGTIQITGFATNNDMAIFIGLPILNDIGMSRCKDIPTGFYWLYNESGHNILGSLGFGKAIRIKFPPQPKVCEDI